MSESLQSRVPLLGRIDHMPGNFPPHRFQLTDVKAGGNFPPFNGGVDVVNRRSARVVGVH
jgi:hypothetical protein